MIRAKAFWTPVKTGERVGKGWRYRSRDPVSAEESKWKIVSGWYGRIVGFDLDSAQFEFEKPHFTTTYRCSFCRRERDAGGACWCCGMEDWVDVWWCDLDVDLDLEARWRATKESP